MIYLPPDEFWFFTVARLSAFFDDGKVGTGTGFFVFDGRHYFLITARHVVDPMYLPPAKKRQALCNKMEFTFQGVLNPGTAAATPAYQKLAVNMPDFCYCASGIDIAAIKMPATVLPICKENDVIRPCSFALSFIANESDLASRHAGEQVIFVGFPDNSPVNHVGENSFYYPLLRQGVFAYPPIHGIDVEGAIGKNYGLIDSYAQSGFSGGPIVSLQKGWPDGSWHPKEHHRPPKVVGVICGHYRSAQDRAYGGHAGLSFFARSTSILSTIAELQSHDQVHTTFWLRACFLYCVITLVNRSKP